MKKNKSFLTLIGILAISLAPIYVYANPKTPDVYVRADSEYFLGAQDSVDNQNIYILEGPYNHTVPNRFDKGDIYKMSGRLGRFKIGDEAFILGDYSTLTRVHLLGLNYQNTILTESQGARSLRNYEELLPAKGSYRGVTIGQNISAVVDINALNGAAEGTIKLVEFKVESFNSEQIFVHLDSGKYALITYSDVLKSEGCLANGYLCVGHKYFIPSTNETVTIVGVTGSGWIREKIEDGKLQGMLRLQKDETFVKLDPGACSFHICTGETYLDAADNYNPVKIVGLSADRKFYFSSLDNPLEIKEFHSSPHVLIKENEKRTSLYGFSLNQKVVVFNGEGLATIARIVGIGNDNRFIVQSGLQLSIHPVAELSKGEGCDEQSKMCIGQKFFLHPQSGEDFSVRISGLQTNGLLVVSTTKKSYANVSPSSLTRKGCHEEICDEKDFSY